MPHLRNTPTLTNPPEKTDAVRHRADGWLASEIAHFLKFASRKDIQGRV